MYGKGTGRVLIDSKDLRYMGGVAGVLDYMNVVTNYTTAMPVWQGAFFVPV